MVLNEYTKKQIIKNKIRMTILMETDEISLKNCIRSPTRLKKEKSFVIESESFFWEGAGSFFITFLGHEIVSRMSVPYKPDPISMKTGNETFLNRHLNGPTSMTHRISSYLLRCRNTFLMCHVKESRSVLTQNTHDLKTGESGAPSGPSWTLLVLRTDQRWSMFVREEK